MAERRISWFKRIRTKILTVIIIVTTLVLGAAGYAAYLYEEATRTEELRQLAEVTADRLSQHIEIPMWDVDYDQVGKLLEAEMKELKVAGIAVRDEDKKSLFAARERDANGDVIESAGNLTGDFVFAQRDITRGDKVIGNLTVFLTPAYLQQELLQLAQGVAAVVLVVDLIMLIIIGSVLSRVVVRPLLVLAGHAERISQGNLNDDIDVTSGDEIGYLSNTMNRMQLSLRVAIQRLTNR